MNDISQTEGTQRARVPLSVLVGLTAALAVVLSAYNLRRLHGTDVDIWLGLAVVALAAAQMSKRWPRVAGTLWALTCVGMLVFTYIAG